MSDASNHFGEKVYNASIEAKSLANIAHVLGDHKVCSDLSDIQLRLQRIARKYVLMKPGSKFTDLIGMPGCRATTQTKDG